MRAWSAWIRPGKAFAGCGIWLRVVIDLGGEMAEWFKARAWKARVPKQYRGFESPSLRHFKRFPDRATRPAGVSEALASRCETDPVSRDEGPVSGAAL